MPRNNRVGNHGGQYDETRGESAYNTEVDHNYDMNSPVDEGPI